MSWAFKTVRQSGIHRSGGAFPALLAIALWSTSGVVSAVAAEKVIQVEGQQRTDPAMITKVTLGSAELQCGVVVSPREVQPVTPFQAGDDWIENLTLYLFNRTDKTITFANIRIGFPEIGDGSSQRPMRSDYITLGRIPPAVAFSASTGQPLRQSARRKAMTFPPGQLLLIDVGTYANSIKGSVDSMPFASITKITIQVSSVYFDDGMKWNGEYYAPDPEHPGKFTRLDGNYFPGDMRLNWPPGYRK